MFRSVLLIIAFALLIAAPARAQAPVDLGPGSGATVSVDQTGTAHIAFTAAGGQVYCRLPRNARACDVRTFLPMDGKGALGNPTLTDRADGALLMAIATNESNADYTLNGVTYYRVSLDRGVTWSGPMPIAAGSYDLSRVALAPGGQAFYTVAVGTRVANLQVAPLSGGEVRTLNLHDGDKFPMQADLAVLPDARVLSVVYDDSSVAWRLFGGGDIYDINAWGTRGTLRRVDAPELVTGPRGTFLFEHRPLASQRTGNFAAPFALRSFDARRLRWRAPRSAAADRSIFGSSTAIEDARGRLHVVADTGGAGLTKCVLYARTGTRASQWFGKTTVLFKTTDAAREPARVRVGAAPDGRGVAVWQDSSNVWALPLRQAKGKYRPKRFQGDRPACVGKEYS